MKNSIHCPIFALNIFCHSLCRGLPLFSAAYNCNIVTLSSGAVLYRDNNNKLKQVLDGNVTNVCDQVDRYNGMKTGDSLIVYGSDENGILERYNGIKTERIDENVTYLFDFELGRQEYLVRMMSELHKHHRIIEYINY